MSDPYEVLGLSRQADEAEARRRYLELVREFSPERAPERFAAIRAAYDQVRDPTRRLEAQIFELDAQDSVEAIIEDLRGRLLAQRLPTATLLEFAESP
jgi:curved DNA-binding protein CbpA